MNWTGIKTKLPDAYSVFEDLCKRKNLSGVQHLSHPEIIDCLDQNKVKISIFFDITKEKWCYEIFSAASGRYHKTKSNYYEFSTWEGAASEACWEGLISLQLLMEMTRNIERKISEVRLFA